MRRRPRVRRNNRQLSWGEEPHLCVNYPSDGFVQNPAIWDTVTQGPKIVSFTDMIKSINEALCASFSVPSRFLYKE